MRKHVRIGSVLLMVAMLSCFAAAVQKPAVQQAGGTQQLVIGPQDVITASDAGGGFLRTIYIVLIAVLVLAVLGLASILG